MQTDIILWWFACAPAPGGAVLSTGTGIRGHGTARSSPPPIASPPDGAKTSGDNWQRPRRMPCQATWDRSKKLRELPSPSGSARALWRPGHCPLPRAHEDDDTAALRRRPSPEGRETEAWGGCAYTEANAPRCAHVHRPIMSCCRAVSWGQKETKKDPFLQFLCLLFSLYCSAVSIQLQIRHYFKSISHTHSIPNYSTFWLF